MREKLTQFSINYSSSADISIEKMTEDLVDIMNISSASTNTYKNKTKKRGKKSAKGRAPWYSSECKKLKWSFIRHLERILLI